MNREHQTEKIKKIFHESNAEINFFDVSDIMLRTSADPDSGDTELTDCEWTKNY